MKKIKNIILIVSCVALVFISAVTTHIINGNLTVNGNIATNLSHGFAYSNTNLTIDVTEDVWSKITNGTNNYLTVTEADYSTFAGDTVTGTVIGHYFIECQITLSDGAGDILKLGLFINSVKKAEATIRMATSTDIGTIRVMWYDDIAVGDDISFKIMNTSSGADPTIRDMHVYYERKME